MPKTDYQSWTKEDLVSEIERLKKRKKYGLVWEEKTEDVVEQCKKELPILKEVKNKEIITDKNKPVNLLIEGDNYHALSVLNYTHAKKIDVIYIDPPYNTGTGDSFQYNNRFVDKEDAFRHSKWISFMSNRIKLAKNLLKQDGVIIVTIDDYEFFNLGLLLDELFTELNRIGIVVIEVNPRGRTTNKFFATCHEYALFYARNSFLAEIKNLPLTEQQEAAFRFEDDISKYRLLPFRRSGGLSTPAERPNSYYPIYYDEKRKTISVEKTKGTVEILPIDIKGKKRVWRQTKPSLIEAIRRGDMVVRKSSNGYTVLMKDRIKEGRKPKTMWIDSKYDASTHGTVLLENILGRSKTFSYPKSLFATKDTINTLVRDKKDAVILDFFAGSGTTGHAVLDLNKEDGGNRQFILCTSNQDENGGHKICEDVCYPRIKKVIEGYADLKGKEFKGLGGNFKYFKTDFVDAEPTDQNKKKLTEQATEMLCIKEGTFEPVRDGKDFKIFKNSDHYTGIIFDQLAIPKFKKKIKNIDADFSVYVFSLGDDTFAEEFADIIQKVKLSPIPEAILRVYRRIFKV